MARKRDRRAASGNSGSSPQAASSGKRVSAASSRNDPIRGASKVGSKYQHSMASLDSRLPRSFSPRENTTAYRAAPMAEIAARGRAAKIDSLNRLGEAHKKATSPIGGARQNQKKVSQQGTLRAPKGGAIRPGRIATSKVEPKRETSKKSTSPERSTQLRDTNSCKARPQNNKGMGNSRAFVPWCGRRS